jgi:hypothetical protein
MDLASISQLPILYAKRKPSGFFDFKFLTQCFEGSFITYIHDPMNAEQNLLK